MGRGRSGVATGAWKTPAAEHHRPPDSATLCRHRAVVVDLLLAAASCTLLDLGASAKQHRLIAVDDDRVLFRTRDGKSVALPPLEFLRRLVQHVLPDRFVKIRHYGLQASSNVATRLERAQALLGGSLLAAHATTRARHTWVELLLELTGIDVRVCRRCGARAVVTVPILGSAPSGGDKFDTS
jgi:hypothetical protein